MKKAAASPLAFKIHWFSMNVAARFSARLAGRIAYRMWFTPWRVDHGERGRERHRRWLVGTSEITFHTSQGIVRGFEAGRGPVVLLVHGWGDVGASMGAFIAPLTNAGYRVVGVDLPGHGASDTTEPNAYAVAGAIREVAASLGGVRFIVSHSFGALVTMVALREGPSPASVVLISPSSSIVHVMDTFVALMKLPARAQRGLRRRLNRRFTDSVWEELSTPALTRGIDIPALVIHDVEDPQVAFEDSVRLVEQWPQARLIPTNALGHGRILRNEDVIGETVSFFRSIDGSPVPSRSLEEV